MRFNYRSEFEEWADLNDYDVNEWHDQETLLEKSYSSIIQFFLLKDNGTYAEVKAYHSVDEGIYDISVEREGLKRTEVIVSVVKAMYT